MRLVVINEAPIVASSPGIKYAGAQRSARADIADIIFYPHSETSGIKHAIQAKFWRKDYGDAWKLSSTSQRDYIELDSQDWEVRVKGGFSFDVVQALIAATRDAMHTSIADAVDRPRVVIQVFPYNDSVLVIWGDSGGQGGLTVQAWLLEDRDPNEAGSWRAKIYELES